MQLALDEPDEKDLVENIDGLPIHIGTRERMFLMSGVAITYDTRYRGFMVESLGMGGCC